MSTSCQGVEDITYTRVSKCVTSMYSSCNAAPAVADHNVQCLLLFEGQNTEESGRLGAAYSHDTADLLLCH